MFSSLTSMLRRLCLFAFVLLTTFTSAADIPPEFVATALQDDATLHDVQFVASTGLAVGDRGTVWKSTDAGMTWTPLFVGEEPEHVSWQSVSLLTNRVAWIAGGVIRPYEKTPVGVIYFTGDGGQTWTQLDSTPLPWLHDVRFFDLDNGVAIGETNARFPSGVFVTENGGRTWTPVSAKSAGRWRAGAFIDSENGVVVGDLGEHQVVARGQLLPAALPASGLANIHAVTASHDGRCWFAGDGALLMTSTNGGVSWGPADTPLPRELDDFANFSALAQVGNHVWVGGSPGSVIWHSSDNGASWQRQYTGSTVPLHSIHFVNEKQGCAVGSLGRIVTTTDGGAHWQEVRGGKRRLALLSLHAHPQRVSLPMLSKYACEEGYRCGVSIFSREDIGPDAHAVKQHDLELNACVLAAGGCESSVGWRLPLAVPGIARDRKRLHEDWSLLTDRRFAEVVISELVAQLRIWRPSVIVIDEPLPDDAAAMFLKQAVEAAVEQAGNPRAFTAHSQFCELSAWQVDKIVERRSVGSIGNFHLDPFDVLPRQQTTLGQSSRLAAACGDIPFDSPEQRHEFVVHSTSLSTASAKNSFWGDVSIAPNSDARRPVPPLRDVDIDKLLAQAKHRRMVTALSQQAISQTQQGGALLAQMDQLIGPLPPAEAAAQLSSLAETYRENGAWALAEETYANLVDRYPNEPAATEAMLWLVKYWTSTELNWQRLRAMTGTNTRTIKKTREQVSGEIEQALAISAESPSNTAREMRVQQYLQGLNPTETLQITPTSGDVNSVLSATNSELGGVSADQRLMKMKRWLEAANAMTDRIAVQHPALYESPDFQFIAASLNRRRQKHREADTINNRFLQGLNSDPWTIAARGEAYLLRPGAISPKPVIQCVQALRPPVLDGVLSDDCWQRSAEITLSDEPLSDDEFVGGLDTRGSEDSSKPRPLVMLCHDAEYLYLAASIPREPQLPAAPLQLPGRPRDADAGANDYLLISFDVDRDYATTYDFTIDQRGWTREACWRDAKYNPRWFVAAEADDLTWRIEAAIPFEELIPPGTQVGATWGLGVTRVMPGLGVHSWTGSGGAIPQPARFGLMTFGR
ncbi:MAG: hypothetical protein KDA88_13830 [Planctomycetaceae bacterium]|nr:hypothetical protein [Planctomycetaceae bacterium]